jgi:hypothetical protein
MNWSQLLISLFCLLGGIAWWILAIVSGDPVYHACSSIWLVGGLLYLSREEA